MEVVQIGLDLSKSVFGVCVIDSQVRVRADFLNAESDKKEEPS